MSTIIPPGLKFRQFQDAGNLAVGDEVVGLRAGVNSRFNPPVPGTASSLVRNINQNAHGFVIGNVLRLNGAACVKAQADNSANANVIGIVVAIVSVNEFTLLFGGYANTLAGLVAGSVYFLDPVTAGAITTVAPVAPGQIRKPILIADSANSAYWINYAGQQL